MVSLVSRGLFWRVYLTLLGSLVLTAVLGALVWHVVMDQPMPQAVGVSGAALGALLPGPDAPRAEVEASLARISASTGGEVVLLDRARRPIAAARGGRIETGGATAAAGAQALAGAPWRTRLADGRRLWIEMRHAGDPGEVHILLVLLAVVAGVGLAAYPIVSRLTRRLERLKSSLDAWGEGRLDQRAEVEGRDEIAGVAASFNAAADRVEGLLKAHKVLLAHASHELRSPLTRLRVAVEMFAAEPDPDLKPGIEADIAELDALVAEILLASRLDQAAAADPVETVDVLTLAAEEAARGRASLRAEASGSYEVAGTSGLMRRLIRNLVDNALKHGQGPVQIDLARERRGEGDWILLGVHDRGPGIPEAERERVFEPFYRPAGRPEAAGSWGLGLSIVRQIAERHGGTATCRARPGGGSSFVVALPAQPDPTEI